MSTKNTKVLDMVETLDATVSSLAEISNEFSTTQLIAVGDSPESSITIPVNGLWFDISPVTFEPTVEGLYQFNFHSTFVYAEAGTPTTLLPVATGISLIRSNNTLYTILGSSCSAGINPVDGYIGVGVDFSFLFNVNGLLPIKVQIFINFGVEKDIYWPELSYFNSDTAWNKKAQNGDSSKLQGATMTLVKATDPS